jgi:O-antigen ligase
MTFSRGGVYNAVGALLFILFFLANDVKTFFRRVIPPLAIVVVCLFAVFPVLDNYTGGMLSARFQSTESTNRADIVGSDFQILAENPLLGVGVGIAGGYRAKFLEYSSASHTEFSRIISEHGILGIFAIVCLLLTAISTVKNQSAGFGRAFKAGMIAWSFLFMMNAGMRLAAPSLLFGLGMVSVVTAMPRKRPRIRRPYQSIARSPLQRGLTSPS